MLTYKKFINRCGSNSYDVFNGDQKIGLVQPVIASNNRPTGKWSYSIEGVNTKWNSFQTCPAAMTALVKKLGLEKQPKGSANAR